MVSKRIRARRGDRLPARANFQRIGGEARPWQLDSPPPQNRGNGHFRGPVLPHETRKHQRRSPPLTQLLFGRPIVTPQQISTEIHVQGIRLYLDLVQDTRQIYTAYCYELHTMHDTHIMGLLGIYI